MHRKTPLTTLVYNALYPSPTPSDPPNFATHLTKYLVGEVRIETATFYGSLDTIEARYPGLNYAHAPHRKRLGRFPYHKKLFEAFDALGLTDFEIQGFCRWEGTLWARERYEKDEGVKVVDTTGMEIGPWVDRRGEAPKTTAGKSAKSGAGVDAEKGINVKTDIEVEIMDVPAADSENEAEDEGVDLDMDDDADATVHGEAHLRSENETASTDDNDNHNGTASADRSSYNWELDERLRQGLAMREQGVNIPMDPAWEQYLKEAHERGELSPEASRAFVRLTSENAPQLEAHPETQAA